MDSLFIAITIFYVFGVCFTYSNALDDTKFALQAYNRTLKHPSLYTEEDKEKALAAMRAAQKLKSQSFVFFIPLVNSFFDYVKSSKETDMTVKNLLAESEREVRQKALEQARAEVAEERKREMELFNQLLQER